ncbi:acylphosphatase [Hymenobacter glacieicola]|uniref:acylphosphatase n=1 Tax=Hymenobacter glacieicola TaxID=1562124 RepID=UPI0016671F77|nr:acylphosphatase [Hymenobacter glacieicola]
MSTVEHRIFRISGVVQGVFYRQSTRTEARRLGLVGYARNNEDGTVTIEAEGSVAALDALEAWCRQGPPAARVEQVTVSSGPVQGYPEFAIQRL